MIFMKILITSAIPYVNNVPHLGNIIGCVLSADVFARYCKSREYDSLYICGTDEYGTATEIKALEEGVSPKEICDKYYKIHKEIYEWFGIKFDTFGRTTSEKHTQITQDIFKALHGNGFVVEDEIEQFFDEKAGMFLADRYIEGTCPHCSYNGARGDQCDKCGKLLTPSDLVNPISKVTKTKPILRKTKHLFINLPGIENQLAPWIEKTSKSGFWSDNTTQIAKSWLREGVKKRAITRDLKWGVPVPLPGYEKKVFYVWFDAPIGYISITACLTDKWKEWWFNPKEVNLYQFMGKDNVPFHTVIFPSTLMGTKQNWTLAHHISTTEFLNYEGGKFSKSRHVGVFGDDAMKSGIPADVWRYYLLINRPEAADTVFTWEDFVDKNNNELLANLGNLVNRTLVFVKNNFEGKVPESELNDYDKKFMEQQEKIVKEITELLEKVRIKEALHKMMNLSKNSNKYFQDNKPWELVKTDKKRGGTVIAVLSSQIKDLAILIEPYLPATAAEIAKQLGIELPKWKDLGKPLPAGHLIGQSKTLFRKIEQKEIVELRNKFAGQKVQTSEVNFEVTQKVTSLGIKAAAAIINVEKISNKSSLLDKLQTENFEVNDSGYAELHRKVKAPEETSIKWLAQLKEKNGTLPNINTLVDSYNLVSLKYGIAAGAHDVSKLKGNVRIDICKGTEPFTELGSSVTSNIPAGEYAALDDQKVICRLELKQCEETKVTKDSKKVLLYYEGHKEHTQNEVNAALKEACELIVKICGGSYSIIWPQKKPGDVEFADLDLEVGEILSVEKHPNAEKLYVEKIKLGDGQRQIVSGIAEYYLAEELIGKKVVVVKNIKSAQLRGVDSQGMILAAEGKEHAPKHDGKGGELEKDVLEVLFADKSAVGDKVVLQGQMSKPKEVLTIKEVEKIKIEVQDFQIVCEGKKLTTQKEEIKTKDVKEGLVG